MHLLLYDGPIGRLIIFLHDRQYFGLHRMCVQIKIHQKRDPEDI